MSKAIYILGGMGPQASVELYRLIIDKAQRDYGAANNDDYPEVVIHSLPVPDFISNKKSKGQAERILRKVVENIDPARFSHFAVACNTAHLLEKELVSNCKVPILSMIDAVSDEVALKNYKSVGLLASPMTIQSKLYQDELAARNVASIVPSKEQLNSIESVIRAVLAGNIRPKHLRHLEEITNSLYSKGAETIVLGCTELPIAFAELHDIKAISSLEVLADRILNTIKENNNA
jgi:aspartate racemase